MTRALVVRLPDCQFNGPGIVPFACDIENFWYKAARLALTEPSPQLYVRRLRWAGEVLAGLSDAGVDVSAVSRKHLLRECNAVQIDESDGLAYLHAFFDALFGRLDVPYQAIDGLLSAYKDFSKHLKRASSAFVMKGWTGSGIWRSSSAHSNRAQESPCRPSMVSRALSSTWLSGTRCWKAWCRTSMMLMEMPARKSCCTWLAPGRASTCTCFPRLAGREAEGMCIAERVVLLHAGSTTTRYEVCEVTSSSLTSPTSGSQSSP